MLKCEFRKESGICELFWYKLWEVTFRKRGIGPPGGENGKQPINQLIRASAKIFRRGITFPVPKVFARSRIRGKIQSGLRGIQGLEVTGGNKERGNQ